MTAAPDLSPAMLKHEYDMAQVTRRAIADVIASDCVKALEGDWRDLPQPIIVRRYAEAVAAESVAREKWLATTQQVSA